MANIFERDYSQASITPQKRIEDIARKSRVPVNVLLGATELAGAKDDAERLKVAGAVAEEFGPRIQAGEDIKALIREAAGSDDAAKAFIDRSRQIALEQYPDDVARVREARKAEAKGGLGAAFGVGVDAIQQGYGSAIEGAGKALGLEGVEKYGADVAARNRAEIEKAAPGLTGVDDIDGIGSGLKFAGEAMAQQVPQLGISIGAGMTGAAAGAAIGGPVGAAIGGIGAGIAANLPFFYGQNRERQKEAIEQGVLTEMDEGAAALTAIPQAALDTIADRLMIGAIAGPLAKAGGGILTRGMRGAAEGVISEVPTEIGQSILERAQAGLPLADDDAIREYRDVGIAAGLIGGVVGGASGAIGGDAAPAGPIAEQADRPEDQASEVAPPAPEPMRLLPAPSQGGTIFGEGAPGVDPTVKEREDWMPRSSDTDPAQQPAQFRQSQPPGGPLRAAMQVAQPEIPPVQNPGAADGQAAAPVQPMGATTPPVAPMGDDTAPPAPEPGPLAQQTAPKARPKPEKPFDFTALTPDQARLRIQMVEDRAKREGWSKDLRKIYDDLQMVVSRAEGEDAAANADSAKIVTGHKGKPFKSEELAVKGLGNLGYSVDGFRIEQRDGGFVAVRNDQPAPETGGAKQDQGNDQDAPAGIGIPPSDAPDGMGGVAPVAPGGPDQPLGGAGGAAVSAVGGPAGRDGGHEQAAERDLADAAAARKPSPTLKPVEGDAKPEAGKKKSLEDIERMAWIVGKSEEVARQVEESENPDIQDMARLARYIAKLDPEKQKRLAPWARDLDVGHTMSSGAKPKIDIIRQALGEAEARAAQAAVDGKTYAPVTPITKAPDQRIQPDMLGGAETTEAAMAGKEKRRKEWGRVLGVASGGSNDDTTLEGRDVLIRRNKIVLRAKPGERSDLDFTIDTGGMDRDTIAARLRGALSELDRVAPVQTATLTPAKAALPADMKGAEKPAPSAAEFKAAAKETAKAPTPAQAEAENYKTGKVNWRGLNLSIENAKGSIRSKVTPDGKTAWKVKMPAHYGRILRTTGADGDHVDFYMGENPQSEAVFVVDQVDADTKAFDEHKVMLGFNTEAEARAAYEAGFSDGKGKDRLGAMTPMRHVDFLKRVADGKWDGPLAQDLAKPQDDGVAEIIVQPIRGGKPNRVFTNLPNGFKAEAQEGTGTKIWNAAGDMVVQSMREWTKDEITAIARDGAGIATQRDNPVPAVPPAKANADQVPLSPQPRGPRRFDWWWTNNRDQRRAALTRAGLDTVIATSLTSEQVTGKLDSAQFNALSDAIFGPEEPRAEKPAAKRRATTTKVSESAAPTSSTYGAQNKLVSADRAAELRERLRAKLRDQLNSGIDPEILAIGAELAVFHIEAGARRFADMAKAIADDLGTTPQKLRPYLRSWYNGARDMMEDSDLSIDGMDDAEQVRAALNELRDAAEPSPAPQQEVQTASVSGKMEATEKVESPNDNRDHAGDVQPSTSESEPDHGARTRQAGSLRQDDREAGGRGSGPSERAAKRSEPPAHGGGDRDGSGAGDRSVGRGPRNHVIEPGGLELARGEKTRARESISAIRTLRLIQSEGRPATAEEREILAKYGGAGTLAGTLPRSDGSIRFPDLASEIEAMTSAEERATLSRTSQYAFYTAESALRGMWSLAQQLGFKGGRVYEPGMGVGGFAGTMPQSLGASYTGLELDHITAQIAAALYPKHTVKHGDFIKEKLPQGFYDLVIGNPPFAGTKIQADPDYPQGFMIHDYFFAKSLDAVRPGGLLMFITSAGTMNKLDNTARNYLADRADLVGAVRLPNTAFKENGTEVTTDIIVLRKRTDGEKAKYVQGLGRQLFRTNDRGESVGTAIMGAPEWRDARSVDLPRDDGTTGQAAVNQYFIDHPEMILGEQGLYDTMNDRVGVRPRPGSDLRADLREAFARFPKDIVSDAPASVRLEALDADHAETKPGSFYIKDGDLYQFDGNTGRKVEPRSRENTKGMPKTSMEAIKALIPIKSALRDVYSADVDGKDATAARKALNDAYDAYVAARGPIGLQLRREQRPSIVEQETARQQAHNDARAAGEDFDTGSFDAGPMLEAGASMAEIARARQAAREVGGYREGDFDPEEMAPKVLVSRPNIDAFMDDPESYRLLAIEEYDRESDTARKTRVFTENAVRITTAPKISSPEDALLHLLGETGRVEPARIAQLAGSTPERVISELEGKIFLNPVSRQWETKARYLSGNVVVKLEQAEREARINPEYQPNVDALRTVQPAPVAASDIAVPVGAHWFPASVYSDFAESIGLKLKAEFKPRLGVWLVDGTKNGSAATSEWGTDDKPFADLMHLLMTNKKIEVRRSRKNADGSTETWIDEEATQAANDKARELQDRFKEWFWSDEARTAEMEALYNRTFNAEVAPQYDGAYLTTPGIHTDWSWRPHQTAVIARILQSGDTYMAHTVGAGKTSAMIGAGMESKRLGLAKKPWYVVPNHMLIQFATEFYQQYPLAKILVADERRFHTSKRKQFVADAALGDYDAIIITHSAFQLIPASESSKKLTVEGMLEDVREVLEGMEGGAWGEDAGMERSVLGALHSMAATLGVDVKGITEGKTKTRKKIEALLEAAEQRISRQTSDKGKDAVFDFDETGADMLFVDEAHLFRKLSFATGMGSIKGIDPQGSQASMDLFIKTRALAQRNPGRSLVLASGTPITNTMAELYSISRYLQPDALEERGISAFDSWAATFGSTESALEQAPDGGYKLVTRFAKFVNTPELSLMVRQVMDVVSSHDLERYVTRPALKDGKRNLVVVEASPELKAFQKGLGDRMRAIENRKGPVKKGDDILLSVINDGRLAAIDLRLVDPSAGDTNSKLDRMIQNIYRRWKDGAEASLYGVKPEGGYTDAPIMRGPSTQIVFSTLGVNPTKHNPSFSVHRFIKSQLVAMGVPAGDIILSETLTSDARKQRAFNDMNEGKKRILIGSKTLFTGVNAQRRIAAIHNLDPLWFPADDEQRNGRGIRQGNMNREIEILDYSAKGTYDATMWQMMARKAGFIEGFFRGDPNVRDMEDLGEASQYEQAKAMSTADPRVLELTELRGERDKLARRAGAAVRQRQRMEATARSHRRAIEFDQAELADWQAIAAKVKDTAGDAFEARAGGKSYTDRKEFGADLISAAEDALAGEGFKGGDRVGTVSGFDLHMDVSHAAQEVSFYIPLPGDRDVIAGWSEDPVGLTRKVENALGKIKGTPARIQSEIARRKRELADTEEGLSKLKGFEDQDKLDALTDQIDALESALMAENAEAKESRFGSAQNETVPVERMRALSSAVQREVAAHGLAGKVTPRVVRGLLGASGIPIQGRYQGGQIEVSTAASDVIGVARHEIIHALRDQKLWDSPHGLFSAEEWRTLVRAARLDKALMARVNEAYDDKPEAARIEEAVAEMYREWAGAQEARGPISRIFGKVQAFFRALASALRGEGFTDAALVMDRIALGQVGGRGPEGPGRGKTYGPQMDMATVSTETTEFKRWFSKSKVVDDNGKPLLVYHATSATFDAFDTGIESHDQWFGQGSYFATSESDLSEHIGMINFGRDDMHIINAYLSIKNPYLWDESTEVKRTKLEADIRAAGIGEDGYSGEVLMNREASSKFTKWAKSQGYDGVFSYDYSGQNVVEIVAFDPTQIKSAFNRGTWSPDDPRILEMRDALMRTAAKAKGMVGRDHWRTPSEWLTDAMAGFGSDEGGQYSILSLVPGRALFAELGKTLMSARAYLRTKEEMDALRNAWHSEADKVSQGWLKLRNRDSAANDEMMDLMHRATLSGVDPSKPLPADDDALSKARAEVARHGPRALSWARDMVANAEQRAAAYAKLKPRFDALPDDFKALYGEVLAKYTAMGDDFEKAVVENIEKNAEIGKKRARRTYEQELRRIEDDGLKGAERQEALDLAQTKLDAVLKHGDSTIRAHLASLRKLFESNRLKGPYVPLARFGVYFVTVRDGDGKVISFSRFEKVKQQQAFMREMEAQHPGKVEHGMISQSAELKRQVDPTFVSEVEGILAEAGASFEVMDAVWQRWLETLPDQSIRTAKIHRKGREGWNRDAFRAFGKHMFHGAHQLARLKYGAQMQDHLEEAKLEARRSDNPNRAGFIVREMEKRHAFTMDPKGGAAVAGLSNLAFIWYLGATPGAALANISQTTVVGVPLMAARFKKAGVSGALRELGRATRDFTRGKGSIENSTTLSADERAAMAEAYRRGTIDKTQAHDLASVAETGIEYNPVREKVMKGISFLFHHTERFNREVTFLASYRLARAEGLTHDSAVEAAADQTWNIHFDYSNTSRPRIMQGDIGKLLTTFRNFTVNMLWRLFRDAHQMFNGATAEERAEARTQLVGITLSMMAHAGIRGTWGYGLAMSLLAVFFPGDDDDIEKWLQDALLMEGDSTGAAAWNYAMGAALNGAPGQILGLDLRERIGMPNLWFRGTDRDLEGEDLYFAHMQELLGPVAGIPLGFYRGLSYAADEQWWRGGEAAVPKAIRDAMKAGRYAYEGVLTRNGDPLLEDVSPWQVLVQMSGFTPAQIAERYRINTRLKNTEAEIVGERQRLHRRASNALRNGDGLSPAIVDEIRDFNRRYPEYPITPDSIRLSMKSRIRASQRSEFGVILNPKLNDRIRGEQPPQVYN